MHAWTMTVLAWLNPASLPCLGGAGAWEGVAPDVGEGVAFLASVAEGSGPDRATGPVGVYPEIDALTAWS